MTTNLAIARHVDLVRPPTVTPHWWYRATRRAREAAAKQYARLSRVDCWFCFEPSTRVDLETGHPYCTTHWKKRTR